MRHRLTAYAVTLFAVLGATALQSGPASAQSTSTLRVGTYNIIAGSTVPTFDRAVRAILPKADVVGFQEVNSKDKKDKLKDLGRDGWGYFRPASGAQEPVVWRSDRFAYVSGRDVKISDQTYTDDEKPGSGTQRDKYVSVVRLQDRASAQRLTFINVHLVSGAVKGGKFYTDRPRLAALYATQVDAVQALVESESEWGQVFVLGDFNVGYVMDDRFRVPALPVATFSSQGMTSMWVAGRPDPDRGTRGTALLDQVYSSYRPTANSIGYDVGYSDHFPAIAKYALPNRNL